MTYGKDVYGGPGLEFGLLDNKNKFKVVEGEFEMIETLYGVGYRFREA